LRKKNFLIFCKTPTEQLEFLVKSFGGQVSVEGPFGTFLETDESITHQVVDRDSQRHMYLGRTYIQPQWVFGNALPIIFFVIFFYRFCKRESRVTCL
jgi:pescadillo protein